MATIQNSAEYQPSGGYKHDLGPLPCSIAKAEKEVEIQAEIPNSQPQAEPSPMSQPDVIGFSPRQSVSTAESEPMSEPAAIPCDSPPPCLFKTNLTSYRWRKSCYFDATVRWGVKNFYTYNHICLPIAFSTPEEEYEALRKDVVLWDVACERQIEVCGPDALKLAEMATPRPIASMKVGEGRYAIMINQDAGIINDPIVLKVAEDRYWFSIADSEMLHWLNGLAVGQGLDVKVFEADVSPLAVQGPKSTDLMKELFGDWVDDVKFYQFRETELDGIPMLFARSGWSPERGYELYLQDESRGDELWEKIMAAGQKYNIKPSSPNHPRRIEGGLLCHGTDITPKHHILEMGLPPMWCGKKEAHFVGKAAVQKVLDAGGPTRLIMGLEFCDSSLKFGPLTQPWKVVLDNEEHAVGEVTSLCFSPTMGTSIAIATLAKKVQDMAIDAGTELHVKNPSGETHRAIVRKLPFMKRAG